VAEVKVGDWVNLYGLARPEHLIGRIVEIHNGDDYEAGTIRVEHPDHEYGHFRMTRIARIIDDPVELLALVERMK